jgi:hypothetical protein
LYRYNADAQRRCAEANANASAAERRANESQAAVSGAIAEAARAVDEVEAECRATVDAAHAAMEVGKASSTLPPFHPSFTLALLLLNFFHTASRAHAYRGGLM